MKHCPVCKRQAEDLYTGLCPNPDCTWEFEFVGTEPTPEMQARYNEELKRAKALFERLNSSEKKIELKMELAVQANFFIDPRDNEKYKIITLEDPLLGINIQWLAENLRFKTPKSWAYDNNENNVKALGRLYTWKAAKKACPPDWRLPTEREWDLLINKFGGELKAGNALKSTKGWDNNGNGTNESGFTALPGGCRNLSGNFSNIGSYGYWWSFNKDIALSAYSRCLDYNSSKTLSSNHSKSYGLSVRCLRNF